MKNLLFSAFILSFVFMGCGGSGDDTTSNPAAGTRGGWGAAANTNRVTSVETQTVSLQPIADQVRSFGTIKAQSVISITPQVSNRITRFYVDLGDTVRQGQLLAKINDATFRDQLLQAEAQVAQSRIAVSRDSAAYYRLRTLQNRDLSSPAEVEAAQASYQSSVAAFESARANLTQANENFNYTEVRSPVRGVIISRTGEEGDVATASQPIFEVANLVGYESRVFLPVQDWRFVKIGQRVKLRVSNEKDATTEGVISRKSPQLDATTGLGEVVISLTNTGNNIYPGVLTESIIDIAYKPQAVVVPRSAMVEKVETVVEPESNTISLDRTYSVFVSVGDTVAELRPLQLGIEQGDKIEVLSGLRPGDKIIVTGQASLKDGSKIRVVTGTDFASPQSEEIATGAADQQQNARPANGRPGAQGGAAFANMSDDERQKIRQRLQNLTPEERRAVMDSIRTANVSNN